jgi:hypothetical protein
MKMPIELAARMRPNTTVPTPRRLICTFSEAMTPSSHSGAN